MLIPFPARTQPRLSPQSFHQLLRFQTSECLQFIDLTDDLIRIVRESGIVEGIVNIQTRHTTTAIIVNENEPLLLEDLRDMLERMAPRSAAYLHDDFDIRTENLTPDEKPNGHAHCKALSLRASEMLNVYAGELQLGRWQRVFLLELDCARERTVSVMILGQ